MTSSPSADEKRLATFREQLNSGCHFASFEWVEMLNIACRLLDAFQARLTQAEREKNHLEIDSSRATKMYAAIVDELAAILDQDALERLSRETIDVEVGEVVKRARAAGERASALAAALDPFARVYDINAPLKLSTETPMRDCCPGIWPTLGDCKRAREALARGAPATSLEQLLEPNREPS